MPSRGSDGDDDFDVMRWWLRSRDGVDDAQDRDVARSCSGKDGYRTEAEARAHVAMNGMQGGSSRIRARTAATGT
jgi:hypothetical protein